MNESFVVEERDQIELFAFSIVHSEASRHILLKRVTIILLVESLISLFVLLISSVVGPLFLLITSQENLLFYGFLVVILLSFAFSFIFLNENLTKKLKNYYLLGIFGVIYSLFLTIFIRFFQNWLVIMEGSFTSFFIILGNAIFASFYEKKVDFSSFFWVSMLFGYSSIGFFSRLLGDDTEFTMAKPLFLYICLPALCSYLSWSLNNIYLNRHSVPIQEGDHIIGAILFLTDCFGFVPYFTGKFFGKKQRNSEFSEEV